MKEQKGPVIDFAEYFAIKYPDLAADRPKLLEAAREIQSFVLNNKTGDVLNLSMPTVLESLCFLLLYPHGC